MTDAIAVGVPIYSRTRALDQLLNSVPEYVATVYVADNGPPDQRDRPPYGREWPFDLRVLDLGHDVGIGACRRAIADACAEPYLWVGDCDMAFTRDGDLRVLRAILDEQPHLGGVSGWLLENGTVRAGARDLVECGTTAVKEATADPPGGHDPVPFYEFDFIPQAGLFRSDVYETYTYDPGVFNSEHFDFFYGHKQAGEWTFASTPSVTIIHDRDIDPEYRDSKRGHSHVDEDILADKWDIERIEPGADADWAATRDKGVAKQGFDLFKRVAPPAVWLRVKAGLRGVGLA